MPGTDSGPGGGSDSGGGGGTDAGVTMDVDAGMTSDVDAGETPGVDAGETPGVDAGGPPEIDAGGPPPGMDAGGPPVLPDAGHDAGRDAGRDAGGPPCSESPCRLVSPQCGCGPGMGCDIETAAMGRFCSPTGPTGEGASCALFMCQAGMDCVRYSASLTWCARYCNTDADCPGGPGSLCVDAVADGTGATLANICTISCNPVTNVGCITGAGCQLLQETGGAMRTLTACGPAGAGGQGAICTSADGCQAGFGCLDTSGSGATCHRWCRVAGGSTCPASTACVGFITPIVVGGTEYGVCN